MEQNADKIMNDWLKLITDEEHKLDESHMKTIELHKEIMGDIEKVKQGKFLG